MTRSVTRVSEWVYSLPSVNAASADPEAAGQQRRAIRGWTAALVLLCFGALWLEFGHIDSTLPYPLHVDEAFIAGPARRTVQTGTLRPYMYSYPSLPHYLAAAGMAVGFVRGAAHMEVRELRRIGEVGYPYYDTPRVMQTTRQLFAVLSMIALAATGFSAWIAFRKPGAILLAPLILLVSPLFFFHSWAYLNVDIVGTCFVMLTIAACLLGTRRPSIGQSAIVPAVFAGFATGSKYTLALVALPVLMAIGLYLTGSRRVWACVAALATMAAAFLAVMPFSLIDIPGFLNGVAYEAFHYASGHRGSNGEPGLPQILFYLRHLASEFGVGGVMLSVLGVSAFAAADWRRAAVLAAFPVALLWVLASQRVHFERNVLSLQPLVAMFAALGLISLHGWALRLAAHRGWVRQTVTWRARVLAFLILAIATVPVWHFADLLRDRTDSRNLAHAWIEARLQPEWTIVVPGHLNFDTRRLEKAGRHVMVVDLKAAGDMDGLNSIMAGVPAPAVIMVPHWGADERYAGQELADALNNLSQRWRIVKTFGTNAVRVNYRPATPRGDPAFSIAVLK